MIELKQALTLAQKTLSNTSDTPRLDAEVLLAHLLTVSRTYLYTHPEKALTPTEWEDYQALIAKRRQGTPIAYLTGQREFWSLPLRVSPATLIPRPDTELLVELALSLLGPPDAPIHLIDLGTGSGAIAIAIAHERPKWQIWAADLSEEALAIARENTESHHLTNIQFFHSDWLTDIPQSAFHAIISNPPYVDAHDVHLTEGDARFEPRTALVSDANGLHDLSHLIQTAYDRLLPNGLLLLEHGYQQKIGVATELTARGYQRVQTWQDTQGHDRVTGGYR